MTAYIEQETKTPWGNPVKFVCRAETSDANTVLSVCGQDEYRIHDEVLAGWAVDIGAHIGSVAIPLALDFPDLRVVAVEAIEENCALIAANAELNGVSDRVTVCCNAASAPGVDTVRISSGYTGWQDKDTGRRDDDPYVQAHRFIGNQYRHEGEGAVTTDVPAISLDSILDHITEGTNIRYMKIDCEGGEWDFLNTERVSEVKTIVGEIHTGFGVVSDANHPHESQWEPGCHGCSGQLTHLADLLCPTHWVQFWSPDVFYARRRSDASKFVIGSKSGFTYGLSGE